MDLFGKTLVLVNFGLSLVMAGVGGAALYYRVDWTNTPASPDGTVPAGELVGRVEKVNKLKTTILPADLAWRDAHAALPAQENRRKLDEAWYVTQLQLLHTDPKRQPILALADETADKAGRTVSDPANGGLPKMAPALDRYGQALKPFDVYNAEQIAVNSDLQTRLAEIAKSEQEDEALTARLVGTKADRGLIQRNKDEQVKQAGLADELNLVQLAEGQVRADSQLLLLRKKALLARIKELGKAGVTAERP